MYRYTVHGRFSEKKRENCEIQGPLETRVQIESSHVNFPGGNAFPTTECCSCPLCSVWGLLQHSHPSTWDLRSWKLSNVFPVSRLHWPVNSLGSSQELCLAASLMQWKDAAGLFGPALSTCLSPWPLLLISRVCASLTTKRHRIRIANCITFIFCPSVLSWALTYVFLHFICQCRGAWPCTVSLLGLPSSWTAEKAVPSVVQCVGTYRSALSRKLDTSLWIKKWRRMGASLVAQWLRICLPMQGTRVRALVWEDPTCRGATGPVSHNYWTCASGACAPQQERPR